MTKLQLFINQSVYSPGDTIHGLVQIFNTTNTSKIYKSFSISCISKLIINKNLIDSSKIKNFSLKSRETPLYFTKKSVFSSNLTLSPNSSIYYYFTLKLPFHIPNSIRTKFYRFVNAIEIHHEEKIYTGIYRVPFCIMSSSFTRIESLEFNKEIFFTSLQEINPPQKILENKNSSNNLLENIFFEQKPFFSISPGSKSDSRLFQVMANGEVIANIEALKTFFYLDKKIRFKISVVKPCKLSARLYCVQDVDKSLLPKELDANLATIKDLKAEKFVDMSNVNWTVLELHVNGDNVPSSCNPIGNVYWWIKFIVTLDNRKKENQFFCICIVPVYKNRNGCMPIKVDYDIENE